MGFINFNRVPKHKKFGFIPRYYDEKKEELENLVDAYKDMSNTDLSKERIRSGLRSKYRGDNVYKKKQERSANFRLLSIIFVLILVTYLILRSDSIINLIQKFSG